MITVGVFDSNTMNFDVRQIEDSLDEYYRIIGCQYIDIATRRIGGAGGRVFDIICDDEGLLKESPVVTALDGEFQPMLVGTLIFAHHDNEGNMTGITEEDAYLLRIATIADIVWPCDYL